MSKSPYDARNSPRSRRWIAVRVVLVRARFFLVLAAALLAVGYWDVLRGHWERWMRGESTADNAISRDTEYWCPMCPGVVSDWPSKCPVCNMTLVRRKKGEMVPLPDGVVARMQFSPYRVQLAGIRTAPVECRPLKREIVLVGLAEKPANGSRRAAVLVRAEASVADLPYLSERQHVEASTDALSGHAPFAGEIVRINRDPERRSLRVEVELDDPDRDLPPGVVVTMRAEAPLARLGWWRRAVLEEMRDATAVDLSLHALCTPACPLAGGGLAALLGEAVTGTMQAEGMGLAVPCDAVMDHGLRKLVFVESGAGTFDAVEIDIGPRCGDFYPVLRGLTLGQRVAASGAFLLDAETWLNHGLAATYFGASRSSSEPSPASSPSSAPPGSLSAQDQLLAAKQKICPVTDAPLDSMGGPVRLEVAGQVVFVCCEGCEKPLRKDPAKYLAKLRGK